MLNVVQMQLKNNLMVLTHCNWNPAKCLFTPRACNLLFEGANISYLCLIILFMFSRYRKNVKKMNYIERWAKRPSNLFTAIFYLSISVMAFKVQIYGRPRQTDSAQPYRKLHTWMHICPQLFNCDVMGWWVATWCLGMFSWAPTAQYSQNIPVPCPASVFWLLAWNLLELWILVVLCLIAAIFHVSSHMNLKLL